MGRLPSVDSRRLEVGLALVEDFELFARTCLRIRTKDGRVAEPFVLNAAQRHIDEAIEAQRAATGKVRAILLKGRQQGGSTYVEGRFYWRTSTATGVNTVVMAHEQRASDNLYGMVQRFHDNMPGPLRASTEASNARELRFGELDSGYQVLTAGTKAVGRSLTATLLHASEFAFWEQAEDHMAGIAQAVADVDGSEIIIESTANGTDNPFARMVAAARAGRSEYIFIFVPWFWQDEYRRKVPEGWTRTEDEEVLVRLYGLDDGQLAFRRNKIDSDYAGDVLRFQQEYPCNPDEAFIAPHRETFLSPAKVIAARKLVIDAASVTGPLVLGVDPARFGDDRTAFAWRRGRHNMRIMAKQGLDTMQVAGRVANIIKTDKPVRVFIDSIGIGAGVVDRLHEMGYRETVVGVNASRSPDDPERYRNKRAECMGRLRDWLDTDVVRIVDHDALQADLLQTGYSYDSAGRIKLESKEDIRKRGGSSPDVADALALTFAQEIADTLRPETPVGGGRATVIADPGGGY